MATISWETDWDGPAHFMLSARERTNLTSLLFSDHTNVSNRQDGPPFFTVPENASIAMGTPILTSPTPNSRDPALARAEIGVLGLVLALTTLGNGFVLWVLLRRRKHRAPMHLFMVNLCVADLVVAIFQVLPQLMWDITERFQGPDALCRLVKYLQIVGMFASSYMIVAMTVDRHYAICCPLQAYHGMATSRWNMPILVAWGLALVLSIPQVFIFSRLEVSPGEFECWGRFVEPWGLKAYVTWMTMAVFVLPTLIITVCQVRIFREIHDNIYLKSERGVSAELKKNTVFFHFCRGGREPRRENGGARRGSKGGARAAVSSGTLLHHSCCGSSTHTSSADGSGDLGHIAPCCDPPGVGSAASDSYSKQHLDVPSTSVNLTSQTGTDLAACVPCHLHPQHVHGCPARLPAAPTPPSVSKALSKTVRMTLVIVLVYTMCWSPFFVVQMWAAWDPNPPTQDVAFTILMLLANLNSCTNPWIYTAFSSSVSRELQALLRCRTSRTSRRASLPEESTGTHTSTTARDSLY